MIDTVRRRVSVRWWDGGARLGEVIESDLQNRKLVIHFHDDPDKTDDGFYEFSRRGEFWFEVNNTCMPTVIETV